MGLGRTWTQEEKDYLQDKWGTISINSIAKNLNRSVVAVQNQRQRLGLGAFLDSSERITFNTLMKALGITAGSGYKSISWVKNRELPLVKLKRGKQTFRMVDIDAFWKWAEKNQSFLDFSNFERYALGAEPDWVESKRTRDIVKVSEWKPNKAKWTKQEDDYLLLLLKQYKYGYAEIAEKLHRTCGAVQRRIVDLGYKERPVRRDAHERWSAEQLELLKNMILSGNNYQEMQRTIGKSEKAIRGKVYVLYRTEVLDKARLLINDRTSESNTG